MVRLILVSGDTHQYWLVLVSGDTSLSIAADTGLASVGHGEICSTTVIKLIQFPVV
jgi:hypothetical protein